MADNLPMVRVDPQQIQQVFLNIINNAQFALDKKFKEKNDKKMIHIQGGTLTHKDRHYVRIVFTDFGVGIPKVLLQKVTAPFFTTKPPGVGTGLGLSISSGIIENHHGFLTIESRENDHTKVIIDLPLRAADLDGTKLPDTGRQSVPGDAYEI